MIVSVDLRSQSLVEILVAFHDTIIVKPGTGHIKVAALASTHKTDRVLLIHTILESLIHPVGVGVAVIVGLKILQRKFSAFDHIIDIILCLHHLRNVANRLDGILHIIEYLAFTFLRTGLCRHKDDTISGLSAIDGGGSGVLEDLHRLDVARIQIAYVTHLDAIDNIQRADGS